MARRSRQGNRGQALVEAACGMILLAGLIIGGVVLVLNTGLSIYYKTKMAVAAEAGARYGVESSEWLGAPRPGMTDQALLANVTDVVNTTLNQMGMPAADTVHTERLTINGKNYLKVSFTVNQLKLMSGGILPGSISLTESSAAAFSNNAPTAVLGLTVGASPNGKGFYIPIYGPGMNTPGPSTFPKGNFPYYAVGIQSLYSNAALGPYQNWQGGGEFKKY